MILVLGSEIMILISFHSKKDVGSPLLVECKISFQVLTCIVLFLKSFELLVSRIIAV